MMDGMVAVDGLARLFQNESYIRALVGGSVVALLCSLLSVYVVFKRMAFIGQGISHSAFAGVGIAMLLGLYLPWLRDPLARDGVIALSCVFTALTIGYLARSGRISEDSAIGICLVGAMALGLVLLDVRGLLLDRMLASGQLSPGELGYTPGFHHILFGNILFVTTAEVWIAGILAGLVLVGMLLLFKELVFFAFDEETSQVFGVPAGLLYFLLLILLALAVVAAMRTLGVILASALLVLPGASARYWSNRIGWVVAVSVLVGVLSLVVGLLLAVVIKKLSPGPVIALMLVVAFIFSYLFHRVRSWRRQRSETAD
ncbi:MAG: metal ABC transporter permease [Phycisphaerae bacterium]